MSCVVDRGCCAGEVGGGEGGGGGEGAQLALLKGGERPEAVGDHAVVLAEVPAQRRQAGHGLAAAGEELRPRTGQERWASVSARAHRRSSRKRPTGKILAGWREVGLPSLRTSTRCPTHQWPCWPPARGRSPRSTPGA